MFYIQREIAYVPKSFDQLTLRFPSNQLLYLEIPPLEFPEHKYNSETQRRRRSNGDQSCEFASSELRMMIFFSAK